MYSKEEIRSKAWLVGAIIELMLYDEGLSIDKIYLVGSYANGRANEYSDIDYLVIVKGGKRVHTYPTWKKMEEIKMKIDNKRIHVIYGVSLDAQKSLYQKDPIKFAFKEIEYGTLSSTSTQS
jgi:predicted nucleotidyltransferase